jgi:hypothetical protein
MEVTKCWNSEVRPLHGSSLSNRKRRHAGVPETARSGVAFPSSRKLDNPHNIWSRIRLSKELGVPRQHDSQERDSIDIDDHAIL